MYLAVVYAALVIRDSDVTPSITQLPPPFMAQSLKSPVMAPKTHFTIRQPALVHPAVRRKSKNPWLM
jgi:hypothetical protein